VKKSRAILQVAEMGWNVSGKVSVSFLYYPGFTSRTNPRWQSFMPYCT